MDRNAGGLSNPTSRDELKPTGAHISNNTIIGPHTGLLQDHKMAARPYASNEVPETGELGDSRGFNSSLSGSRPKKAVRF